MQFIIYDCKSYHELLECEIELLFKFNIAIHFKKLSDHYSLYYFFVKTYA